MSHGGQENTGSNEDQNQELRDMVQTNRGIEPGLQPEDMVPRRPTRITHHEIKAMKVTVRKESSPMVGLLRSVEGVCKSMLEAIGSMFSWGRARVNPCDVSGHTFPKHWKGDFPRCKHCQVLIKSPDEINPNKK
jgi:hypothetical protein